MILMVKVPGERTGKKGYILGFSTIHKTDTPVHARFTQIRDGFADGFATDSQDSRGFATDSQMGSQRIRKIRKIRNGFARFADGFATDSQDSQDSQMDSQIREIRGGFADIRNGFASRFAWIRTRFAKIRRYSRKQYAKIRKDSHEFALVSQGSHVYAHCESEEEPLLTTHWLRPLNDSYYSHEAAYNSSSC